MSTEAATLEPQTPPVDPAVVANATPPAANEPPPAPPASDPPAPPPAEPPIAAADDAAPKPHGNKGRKPWYLDRISEEADRARQAEARAEELRAQLARVATDPATPPPPAADNEAIEARARQIAQETLNQEKIKTVVSAGISKFTDWDDRMATLGAAGAATPEFALDVHSVDPLHAHEILHALADDPQKASRLARMDTRTRTIELVKLSLAAQGKVAPVQPTEKPVVPAPRTVSRAPAPPPSVEPSTTTIVDWRTDPNISDQEWSKKWDENAKQRHAARR